MVVNQTVQLDVKLLVMVVVKQHVLVVVVKLLVLVLVNQFVLVVVHTKINLIKTVEEKR